jgi:hypothetical protein
MYGQPHYSTTPTQSSKLWNFHHSSIQLFLDVVKLIEKMEDLAVRRLNVRRFRELMGLEKNNQGGEVQGIAAIL